MHNYSIKIPKIIKISELNNFPEKSMISIAGILIIKQKPSTAKGVTFLSLEDESGTANVVIWKNLYQKFSRHLITGNLLKVTGHLEKQGPSINIISKKLEDLSYLLNNIDNIS